MTAKDIASQPSADWDEAQCTSALALLEGLQAQVIDCLERDTQCN